LITVVFLGFSPSLSGTAGHAEGFAAPHSGFLGYHFDFL
jgi:hypothetical protein